MSTYDALTAAADTKAFITHAQSKGDEAIARLTTSATSWTVTALNAVTALSLGSLSAASGTKPSLLTLSLPTYTAADISGLASPTLPTAPSLAGGTAPMWSEAFWSDLKTRIGQVMTNVTGSDDVDTLVTKLTIEQDKMSVALYAKEYERKTQTLRDLYSAAQGATGAKGFSFPNSMTTALQMDAQQKFQFDMSDISRTIITHVFEWAKSNLQFSMQQGISAHNSDTEFNTRYLETTARVYTATVGALVEKYRADVTMAVAKAELKLKEFVEQVNTELGKQRQLEEIRIKEAGFDLEVAKTNADIAAKDITLKLDDFKARVSNFLETAKVNLADRDANVKNQITASTAAATATIALASGASTIMVNTAGA